MTTAQPTTTRVVTLARRPAGAPQPADFALEERALPELGPGQLLVRNAWMSVDPSMRGRLEETEKHYTTNFRVGEPLDGSALGRVLDSRAAGVPTGAWVRHRLGWRDVAVVDAATAAVVDPGLAAPADWLGVLGQTGFTAYVGLVRAAELRAGDAVFVSAAAGAVGSAAGQLARLLGAASVVGSAGGARKAALLVDELGLDGAVDHRAERVRDGLARVAPEGIDVYFDNVGGDHLVAALESLRQGGRVALCGMISQFDAEQRRPSIDHLIQAVLKRVTLRGFIVRDHEDLRPEFERRVAGWLRSGELVAKQTVADDLGSAVTAFLGMLRGANVGKMLVRLDPSVQA
ncbi:zinc-binding dehydrogenase [Modestobacter sp. I12A-02628]|uniref:NADP-dependent oxidoreductase n=1 Tax=Goekera deserti TaxID=2497753 RepID=A0A7K3WG32_9ACTN|nr:NADP-dependent oxidoreductase [Goekera deserti]MPQ96533.1 zinc-binding dehydrogenase [Goekera deserti]NDI47152.1 zinc-binding dehydrogenase [Goekera deserti]NEL55448.1 NADP-dependent oxidoreductase [Goekera deserti]